MVMPAPSPRKRSQPKMSNRGRQPRHFARCTTVDRPLPSTGRVELKEPRLDEPLAYGVESNDGRGIAFHPEGGCYAIGRLGVRIVAVAEEIPLTMTLQGIGTAPQPVLSISCHHAKRKE